MSARLHTQRTLNTCGPTFSLFALFFFFSFYNFIFKLQTTQSVITPNWQLKCDRRRLSILEHGSVEWRWINSEKSKTEREEKNRFAYVSVKCDEAEIQFQPQLQQSTIQNSNRCKRKWFFFSFRFLIWNFNNERGEKKNRLKFDLIFVHIQWRKNRSVCDST